MVTSANALGKKKGLKSSSPDRKKGRTQSKCGRHLNKECGFQKGEMETAKKKWEPRR